MSAASFQSDSYLVDTALARLRIDARLDDDPVLPKIEALPSYVLEEDIDVDIDDDGDFMEVDASELIIDCKSVRDLPSAATIVREAARANARPQKEVPTLRTIKTAAAASSNANVKHARWPVILCALVATYFGTTAFLKSPLGAKPEVQHVVKVTRGHIAGAISTTRSVVRL